MLTYISLNSLFQHIKNLQCYELTGWCSHLRFYSGFTIDLCCVHLIWALWMYTNAKTALDFELSLLSGYICKVRLITIK